MTPEFSIIMPVFNAARYLRTALESVRGQTFGDFECICVDDGSTDGSAGILEEFSRGDSRFRIFKEAHRCAGAARNLGLEKATGHYLAFLDSDDYYEPDFLSEMLAAFDRSDRPEVVVCAVNRFWGETDRREPAPWYLEADAFARGDTMNFTPGNPWNKVFLRSFVEREGLRFLLTPHSEDIGFVFPALAFAGRISLVEKPLVNYRADHAESLEHTKSSSGSLVFYDAYLQVRDFLMRRGVSDKVRASFLRRVGRAFSYNLNSPRDLACLEMVVRILRDRAVVDFGFLQEVPTVFDRELREMGRGGFQDFILNRLRRLRGIEGTPPGNVDAERQFRQLERRAQSLEREVQSLKRSFAYRVGMMVTVPARYLLRKTKHG